MPSHRPVPSRAIRRAPPPPPPSRARRQLDLQPFYPGARVRYGGAFHAVVDPFRRPLDALATLLPSHPIGTLVDKLLVGVLRLQARRGRKSAR